MQRLPEEELREALSLVKGKEGIDNQTAIHINKKLADEFRQQLMVGAPTNEDEAGLRRLAAQIRAGKERAGNNFPVFLKYAIKPSTHKTWRRAAWMPTNQLSNE